jgi:hypothetical protein
MLPVLTLLAVPRLIEGDDAVIAGERIDLMLPILAVATPAVEKDKCGVARAPDFANEV